VTACFSSSVGSSFDAGRSKYSVLYLWPLCHSRYIGGLFGDSDLVSSYSTNAN